MFNNKKTMKMNFIHKFLVVLLTASMFLGSCVDDEVAPEVAALRQAQTDLIKSKTAMQDLQNTAQGIMNDFEAAINALELQSEENRIAHQEAMDANREAKSEQELQVMIAQMTYTEATRALSILAQTESNSYNEAMHALNIQSTTENLTYDEARNALSILAQTATTSYTEAYNAIRIEMMTAQLEGDLVNIEAQAKYAERQLVDAEKALEVALADMAKYIATSGIAEAEGYLDEYGWSMDDYYDVLRDIVFQETDIAQMSLALAADPDLMYSDAWWNDYYQTMIDEDTAELTALQALLEDLKAVATDPTAAEAAINSAKIKIQELENTNAQLMVDIEKYQQDVVSVAQDALAQAVGGYSPIVGNMIDGTINEYNNAKADIDMYSGWIVSNQMNIGMYMDNIESYNTDINKYKDQLVLREAILATNTAEYETQEALRLAAEEVRDDAIGAMALAQNNMELVGLSNQALWDDFWNANNKLNDANNEFWNAKGELSNAEQDLVNAKANYDADYTNATAQLALYITAEDAVLVVLNAAQAAFDAAPTAANLTTLNAARNSYDNAVSDTSLQQNYVDWLSGSLADAESALPLAEAALVAATTNRDLAQATYDAADDAYWVAGNAASQAAQEVYNTAQNAYSDASGLYSDQYSITQNARSLMDDAQYQVDWRENNIENYENNINYYNGQIEQYENSIVEDTLEIANLEAIITNLQTAYDALTPAAIFALEDALDNAEDAYYDMGNTIYANSQKIYAQEDLIDVLEDQLDDINEAIEDVEDEIEGLMENIASLKVDLADNAIDKAEAIALLAAEEVQLDILITERDGILDTASKLMELYLAAIE